ncbi:glyoxalase [Frateuria sp. Soil773]|uniref:VOC family protein n=1 Tax=Frateuria sp. Soil773 TaxID=1736407 RepID=UPI0006F35AC3|nr:VOC family protein [Frateuria sp. Soil773]KRE97869.1 glyoxalase [Frateuria sp. Soil773]
MIRAIDHVQLAMPAGGEPMARQFYVGALGLAELPKPPVLAARGGAWFGRGAVQLHLGVDEDFHAARKAHPGLLVDDLDGLLARLRAQGIAVREDSGLPGYRRAFVADPFGNRIELMQSIPSS